jgi:hypothetical protein
MALGKMEGKQLRYIACLDARMPPTASRKAAERLASLKIVRCPFAESRRATKVIRGVAA